MNLESGNSNPHLKKRTKRDEVQRAQRTGIWAAMQCLPWSRKPTPEQMSLTLKVLNFTTCQYNLQHWENGHLTENMKGWNHTFSYTYHGQW